MAPRSPASGGGDRRFHTGGDAGFQQPRPRPSRLVRVLGTWLGPWESFEYTPKRWLDGGDHVVVDFVQRARLAGGLEYATRISNVWTFEGEAVVRLQVFITWEEALEAAGLSE